MTIFSQASLKDEYSSLFSGSLLCELKFSLSPYIAELLV